MISLVTDRLVFVAETSFVSFTHGFDTLQNLEDYVMRPS